MKVQPKDKCAYCGTSDRLTIDHVIPQWLWKRRHFIVNRLKVNILRNPTQFLCQKCNTEVKGGSIDVIHPDGAAFWQDVKNTIERALENAEDLQAPYKQ